MKHNWDLYFDTSSEYWGKIQKIYEENEKYPKKIVKGRNLHHKFMRSFSKLEKVKIDNDKDNLVSLDLADHYLVHYYLWKCTKAGFRNRTALAFRLMNKRMQKYVNDETVELLAQEYKNAKKDCIISEETRKKLRDAGKGKHHSEESRKKISETLKGRKCKPVSAETRKKMSKAHIGHRASEETRRKMSESLKGHCKGERNGNFVTLSEDELNDIKVLGKWEWMKKYHHGSHVYSRIITELKWRYV